MRRVQVFRDCDEPVGYGLCAAAANNGLQREYLLIESFERGRRLLASTTDVTPFGHAAPVSEISTGPDAALDGPCNGAVGSGATLYAEDLPSRSTDGVRPAEPEHTAHISVRLVPQGGGTQRPGDPVRDGVQVLVPPRLQRPHGRRVRFAHARGGHRVGMQPVRFVHEQTARLIQTVMRGAKWTACDLADFARNEDSILCECYKKSAIVSMINFIRLPDRRNDSCVTFSDND